MPSKPGGQKRQSSSESEILLWFAFHICRKKFTQVLDAKQLDDEEERHEQVGRTPCLAQAAEQSEQVCPLHIDRRKTSSQITDHGGIVAYCVLDFK